MKIRNEAILKKENERLSKENARLKGLLITDDGAKYIEGLADEYKEAIKEAKRLKNKYEALIGEVESMKQNYSKGVSGLLKSMRKNKAN